MGSFKREIGFSNSPYSTKRILLITFCVTLLWSTDRPGGFHRIGGEGANFAYLLARLGGQSAEMVDETFIF